MIVIQVTPRVLYMEVSATLDKLRKELNDLTPVDDARLAKELLALAERIKDHQLDSQGTQP